MFYVLFWPLSSQKLCYTPAHRLSHQPHGMCSAGRGPVAPASGSRAWTWRVCRLIPCLRAREWCFPRKVKTLAPADGPCPGLAVTFESVRQSRLPISVSQCPALFRSEQRGPSAGCSFPFQAASHRSFLCCQSLWAVH